MRIYRLLVNTLHGIKEAMDGKTEGWRFLFVEDKWRPSFMFVLWQNRGLFCFPRKKWTNLSSHHHHVRVFEILWVLFFFFFLIRAWRKWIWASVAIQAWRCKWDPHDHCPFPHHYRYSHGCNKLNWAIDFSHASLLSPTKPVCATSAANPVLFLSTEHLML